MTVRSVQVIFRARLIYSKRGGACFVPHIALAQIFARSASRAGFSLEMTQGFSPRPRLSFGPELPAGVVALNEPLDIYFAQPYPDIITHMNDALPEGFALSQVWPVPENSPSLGKSCTHAEYFLRSSIDLADLAKNFYGENLILSEKLDDWLRIVIAGVAQNPIGGFVKSLIREELLQGWHQINIVRIAVGSFDQKEGRVIMNA